METAEELAIRFAVGGIVVSTFAALGEIFAPKSFAGLFSAAPSVALATLAVTFAQQGWPGAVEECRTMMIGAVALIVYTSVCIMVVPRPAVSVWLGTTLSWTIWLALSFGLYWLLHASGGVP